MRLDSRPRLLTTSCHLFKKTKTATPSVYVCSAYRTPTQCMLAKTKEKMKKKARKQSLPLPYPKNPFSSSFFSPLPTLLPCRDSSPPMHFSSFSSSSPLAAAVWHTHTAADDDDGFSLTSDCHRSLLSSRHRPFPSSPIKAKLEWRKQNGPRGEGRGEKAETIHPRPNGRKGREETKARECAEAPKKTSLKSRKTPATL